MKSRANVRHSRVESRANVSGVRTVGKSDAVRNSNGSHSRMESMTVPNLTLAVMPIHAITASSQVKRVAVPMGVGECLQKGFWSTCPGHRLFFDANIDAVSQLSEYPRTRIVRGCAFVPMEGSGSVPTTQQPATECAPPPPVEADVTRVMLRDSQARLSPPSYMLAAFHVSSAFTNQHDIFHRCRQTEDENRTLLQRVQIMERRFAAQENELSQLRSKMSEPSSAPVQQPVQQQQAQPLAAPSLPVQHTAQQQPAQSATQPLAVPLLELERWSTSAGATALQRALGGGGTVFTALSQPPPPRDAGPIAGVEKGREETGEKAGAGGGVGAGGVGEGAVGGGEGKGMETEKKAKGRPRGSLKPENVCSHNLLRTKCKECRVDRCLHVCVYVYACMCE